MTGSGATPAYRGYRLQALYTLRRILSEGNKSLIFHPEGHEDLGILDANGRLLEVIQVKSYDGLVLSNLEPSKKDSFFCRVIKWAKSPNPPVIKLVNFGPIGPEMRQAWQNQTATERAKRQSITNKLKKKGKKGKKEFTSSEVAWIFRNVELVERFEKREKAVVYQLLQDMLTGRDPENAFDLLNFWLYRASEEQRQITKSEVIEKISHVGRFLAECDAHHTEWFTSIRPIMATSPLSDKEREELRKEFYQGVSARYKHILADLDFRREAILVEITECFERRHVIIIHAASGQGKTTLAYRYLHDTFPENWRFAIELIENRQHALKIAQALSGHAQAIQAPMAVYIDVRPSDTAWPELVRQLARHPYLKVLVTVREEDFRRASLPRAEFEFEEIDLAFNKDEAQLIFERAIEAQPSAKYLDFEAAFHDFGGEGPLMEFVYLLTQAKTLTERLKGQVQAIRVKVRERKLLPEELHLLRLVAVATAYEARLHTPSLIKSLNLPAPRLTLNDFEEEYLIRQSDDKQYIEALHPIRSRILTSLLTSPDINPWLDIATEALPLLLEDDLENFILHAFVDRPQREYKSFLSVVNHLKPNTWTGIAGVLRSLLWAGVHDYIETNRHLIDIIRQDKKNTGGGWWMILDLTNVLEDNHLLDFLWPRIPKWKQEKITKLRQSQTPKSDAFKPASSWLSSLSNPPCSAQSDRDWANMAEVFYWSAHLSIAPHIETWLTNDELGAITTELPLVILADLSVALHLCNQKRHICWIQANRQILEARLAREYHILALEEEQDSLKIHFLPLALEVDSQTEQNAEAEKAKRSDPLHSGAMERVQLMLRLFPTYSSYHSQGYGHRLGSLELPLDSTVKRRKRENINLSWPKRITGIAGALGGYAYRLETWTEYVNRILEIRQLVIDCMRQVQKGIIKFIQGGTPKKAFPKYIDTTQWDVCKDLLNEKPKFPKCAIDQWGFASENTSTSYIKENTRLHDLSNAIALQKYKPYLTAQRNCLGSMSTLFKESMDVIITNSFVGRRALGQSARKKLITDLQNKGFDTERAHISVRNFWKAVLTLPTYQMEFRKLFGHLVEPDLLDSLEEREREILPKTWQLWYFFSYFPHQRERKAHKAIPRTVAKKKRELDRKIKQAINKIRSHSIKMTILTPEMRWENSPTLWLRLDLNDPTQLYQTMEELIWSLRTKLGPRDVTSLIDYLIEEHYKYTVIIPVIRQQMLNELVWPLNTAVTLLSTEPIEKNIWSFGPKPLPSEMREALSLGLWDIKDISLANQFSIAVNSLRFLVAQINEFNQIPQKTEAGLAVLETHLAERSQTINQFLNSFIEAKSVLTSTYNELSSSERQRRAKLAEAVAISDEYVLPFEGQESPHLSLRDMAEYEQLLEEASLPAENVKLLWIADVLENHPI